MKKDHRPLWRDGFLAASIFHQADATSVYWGSNLEQSAVMQFGAAKGALGAYSGIGKNSKRRYSGVAPWGDIPARPFLGISDEDEKNIGAILEGWLQRAVDR